MREGRMKRTVLIGIAPDSFKGSLTAREAADCIERGLKSVLSNISVRKIPMADGGEGTVYAIVEATGGRLVWKTVRGPRRQRVRAAYGITGDGRRAIIEMAAASGLALLKPRERNPMVTTTFGTGELIRDALERNVTRILVGIGGSATNDGGVGMARALGIRFLDNAGRPLPEGGGTLRKLAKIDMSGLHPRAAEVVFEVACDVDNPLVGPRGAAQVFGPQKGATPAMVRELDAGLRRLASVTRRDLGVDIADTPGSGAAGGLGGGLMAFLRAKPRSGVDIVSESVDLAHKLKGCHLVITGEGRMDGQTVFGKTPVGVARVARKLGIPVIAIPGSVGRDVGSVHGIGIEAYVSALQETIPEEDLAARGPAMLEDCAAQVGRLLALRFRGRSALRRREQQREAGIP